LSLVLESRRQSEAVNHILQIAVRAIADYANRQTALSDSLGLILEPPLSTSIFDILEPIAPSEEIGYKAVEEDARNRRRRRALLNDYLASLQIPPESLSPGEETCLQQALDRVPAIFDQFTLIEHEEQRMENEMEQIRELQLEVLSAMDDAEALFTRTTEIVDTTYPQLSGNEELARQLGPDSQVLPEWVPESAQAFLFTISPVVRILAEFILWCWKHNYFSQYIPESAKNATMQFLLNCMIVMWNVTVKAYGFVHWTMHISFMQRVLGWLISFLLNSKSHPFRSLALLASALFVLQVVRSIDSRVVASFLVQQSNT